MSFNKKEFDEEIKNIIKKFYKIISKNSKKGLYNLLDDNFKKNISMKKFIIYPKYELSLGKLKNIKIENVNKKSKRAMVRTTYIRKGELNDENIYLVYQDEGWRIDGEMLFRH